MKLAKLSFNPLRFLGMVDIPCFVKMINSDEYIIKLSGQPVYFRYYYTRRPFFKWWLEKISKEQLPKELEELEE